MKPNVSRSFCKVKSLTVLLVLLTMFLPSEDLHAQTRRKRTQKDESIVTTNSRKKQQDENYVPFAERLNSEIRLGNLGIGTQFAISLKPSIAYKFGKVFSSGIGARAAYTYINQPFGFQDLSFFDYGGFVFARAKLFSSFYLQGEYASTRFDFDTFTRSRNYPLAGAGYMSTGGGNWSYGMELMFILDDQARDLQGSLVEYWITFSHRF